MIYDIVAPDGTVTPVERDEAFSLEELQQIVGRYIEFVYGYDGEDTICVNEEGRIMQLPQNQRYPDLVGNVVVGKSVGDEFVGKE